MSIRIVAIKSLLSILICSSSLAAKRECTAILSEYTRVGGFVRVSPWDIGGRMGNTNLLAVFPSDLKIDKVTKREFENRIAKAQRGSKLTSLNPTDFQYLGRKMSLSMMMQLTDDGYDGGIYVAITTHVRRKKSYFPILRIFSDPDAGSEQAFSKVYVAEDRLFVKVMTQFFDDSEKTTYLILSPLD